MARFGDLGSGGRLGSSHASSTHSADTDESVSLLLGASVPTSYFTIAAPVPATLQAPSQPGTKVSSGNISHPQRAKSGLSQACFA